MLLLFLTHVCRHTGVIKNNNNSDRPTWSPVAG